MTLARYDESIFCHSERSEESQPVEGQRSFAQFTLEFKSGDFLRALPVITFLHHALSNTDARQFATGLRRADLSVAHGTRALGNEPRPPRRGS